VGDGTGAQQLWDSPLSGAEKGQRKGLNPIFNNGGMRPAVGSDFLLSRHFPDEVQGQFIYACVINMNGIRVSKFTTKAAASAASESPICSNRRTELPSTDRRSGPTARFGLATGTTPHRSHAVFSARPEP
jgi:hypothetical protein